MRRIVILTTGGTIAMRSDARAGGAIPSLRADDLSGALAQDLAQIRAIEFSNLPSAHFTLDLLWDLSRRVAALAADRSVDGIVVTHGTDTLEESAYLCDLTINSDKPIVFTGAMRNASEIGYEGLANLESSIRVAASDGASGLGTLVLFNDEVFAAQDVTKTHTTNIATFRGSEWGPLGRLDAGGLVIARARTDREYVAARHLASNVHLLKITVGMGTELLSYLVESGAKGIVLEALGGGRVPPWWLATMAKAVELGIPIVITSRVGAGRTVDSYGYAGAYRDLRAMGCWFARGLNGPKARIKLMAALGTDDPSRCFSAD